MTRSLHEVVTVKEGGLIELRASDIPAGTRAHVSVIFESAPLSEVPAAPSMAALFGAGKSFTSGEDVDQFIRQERDSWDD